MSRFQNIFSTPGPGYLVSRPIYFDSPAESSGSSDPALEIKYDIECAELDFQWKPYDRSRTYEPQNACVPSDSPSDHLSDDGPGVGVTKGTWTAYTRWGMCRQCQQVKVDVVLSSDIYAPTLRFVSWTLPLYPASRSTPNVTPTTNVSSSHNG